MTIRGKVVLNEKGLQGVKVVLKKNGSKMDEALTGSSGKYTFNELEISPDGDTYIIKISKPGHISVKHWVSTKAPDERAVVYPDYFPEVELFKMVKEVEKEKALSEILNNPISKFGYSVSKGDFSDDRAYFSTIKARVNQLFEILDAEDRERKRLLAAYRLKQMELENLNKAKEKEEAKVTDVKSEFEIKYEEALANGDVAFEAKNYREAMSQYKTAMVLVSKSKLKKSERDKLKKYPKRKIYDLETIMAGITDEELDKLENGVAEEEVISEETVVEEEEEELNEIEEEILVGEEAKEEATEQEIEIAEAETSMPNAMEERDRMLEEQWEIVAQKRKENMEIAAAKTMTSNAVVKEHVVAMSIAKKKEQAKVKENKEAVAQRNKEMMIMMANSKRGTYSNRKKALPSESVELRPGRLPETALSNTAADKDKKQLTGSVVIIHNRIKVSPANKKIVNHKKTVSKTRVLKPKSVSFSEESLFKTVKNTIITYPIRQDTLQQVDYRWGTSYYYRNTEEIDHDTYERLMKVLQ